MTNAWVLCDLSAGDGGKGSMTEYLVRSNSAKLVVRYSGGPQSSHHVVLEDCRSHAFSQMGAGTFAGAHTYLSQHVLFEVWAFMNELDALAKVGIPITESLEMLQIHEDCVIVSPWAWKLNRIMETARGDGRHGSCGRGIGITRADELEGEEVLRVKDLGNCEDALRRIWERKIDQAQPFGDAAVAQMVNEPPTQVARFYEIWAKKLKIVAKPPEVDGPVVFEGSQGILIDERWGWEPYRTWTDCTPTHAREIAAEMKLDEVEVIGIAPAVMTRHGKGPFVTEVANEEQRASLTRKHNHNVTNEFQGALRHGFMDMVALRYALRHAAVDCLALTKWDCFDEPFTFCDAYYHKDKGRFADIPDDANAQFLFDCEPELMFMDDDEDRIGAMEKLLGKPIRYVSTGPTHLDKEVRMEVTVV